MKAHRVLCPSPPPRHASSNLQRLCKYFPPFKFKRLGFVPLPIPLPDTSKFIQLPDVEVRFEDEDNFGEQRLAGLNPGMLRSLDKADPHASTLLAAMPGAADAIAAGAPAPTYERPSVPGLVGGAT